MRIFSKVFNKTNANIVLFLWFVFVAFSFLAVLSPIPVLALRYYYLPLDQFTIPLDFVPKQVRAHQSQISPQLVALIDLSKYTVMSNEDYSIDLELVLPRNDANREFGNFAVRGALGDHDWTKSRRSLSDTFEAVEAKTSGPDLVERMALLPYKSNFIESVRKLVLTPFYVLGLKSEESTMNIKLWEHALRPRLKHPYVLITIPSDLWVSRATLKMEVQLSGFRWLLHTFPITTFFIGSSLIFVSEVSTTVLVMLLVYIKATSPSKDVHFSQHEPRYHSASNASFAGSRPLTSVADSHSSQARKNGSPRKDKPVKDYTKSELRPRATAPKVDENENEDTIIRDSEPSVSFTECEIGLLSPEYP